MNKKIKLCYAINEYNKGTDTHYNAIYELIKNLSKDLDVFLILEKKSSMLDFKVKNHYESKFNNQFLKFIELFLVSVYARFRGYNRFYSHYTTFSRLNFGIISRITFAKSYHWHCGVVSLFWNKKIKSIKDLKVKILQEFPERLSWKLNHFLVTGSKSMKLIYHRDFGIPVNKIKDFPNWVDFDLFDVSKFSKTQIKKDLKISPHNKIILFVHRIVERKGAHYIIPIFKKLIKKDKGVVFLIVGAGPYLEKLKMKISEEGFEKQILTFGKVPNFEIPKFFSIVDVFIMPSEEEGFPRVLLESMAMGVPYVASDIGGVKEITPEELRNNICEVGNVDCFADKILKIKKYTEEEKKNLIAYSKSNYSMEIIKIKFINLLD